MAVKQMFVENRPFTEPRQHVIASSPALQERASAKTRSLIGAVASALGERGLPAPQANLAAQMGMATLSHGVAAWFHDASIDLGEQIARAFQEANELSLFRTPKATRQVLTSRQKVPEEAFKIAERLRELLSRWIHTTRDQAGTPGSAKVDTLRLLYDRGPATIAALAENRTVKHQSMRLVIAKLADDEAVRKSIDPRDRRNQVVSITAKGRSILKQEQRFRALWIAKILHGCTAEESAQVIAAMDILETLLHVCTSRRDSE